MNSSIETSDAPLSVEVIALPANELPIERPTSEPLKKSEMIVMKSTIRKKKKHSKLKSKKDTKAKNKTATSVENFTLPKGWTNRNFFT